MSTGFILILVIIIVVAAVAIPSSIKKRRAESKKTLVTSHHNKDEVWKATKQFLKDEKLYGNEIVDSYVAKRNNIDYINPNSCKLNHQSLHYANKIREYQYQQAKLKAKKENSNVKFTRPPMRDVYVVCFLTRDTKTKKLNPPQAIECEVITKKIDRKTQDRKILINGEMNFDKEMEWIAPLRNAETARNIKLIQKQEKKQQKILAKAEAKKQKQNDKK